MFKVMAVGSLFILSFAFDEGGGGGIPFYFMICMWRRRRRKPSIEQIADPTGYIQDDEPRHIFSFYNSDLYDNTTSKYMQLVVPETVVVATALSCSKEQL